MYMYLYIQISTMCLKITHVFLSMYITFGKLSLWILKTLRKLILPVCLFLSTIEWLFHFGKKTDTWLSVFVLKWYIELLQPHVFNFCQLFTAFLLSFFKKKDNKNYISKMFESAVMAAVKSRTIHYFFFYFIVHIEYCAIFSYVGKNGEGYGWSHGPRIQW